MKSETRASSEMAEPDAFKYREEDVIRFDKGILGFPDSRQYILIPHEADSPFAWLQSVDEENLAFLMINPVAVKSDYVVQLPEKVAADLKLTDASEGVVFAIVVVPEVPQNMRMNLRAPVIINVRERLGRQVVLEDTSLDLRCPILSEEDQVEER